MHTAKLTVVIIDRCPGAYLQTCEGEWSAEKISKNGFDPVSLLVLRTHLFPIINVESFICVQILRIAGNGDQLVKEQRGIEGNINLVQAVVYAMQLCICDMLNLLNVCYMMLQTFCDV